MEFAHLCGQYKRMPLAAYRLYADAFNADPKPSADLLWQHRYNAACYAALAAGGQGEDTPLLPDKVVVMLRRQALQWLRADLALWATHLQTTRPEAPGEMAQALRNWQQNRQLAAVRDREALAPLPVEDRQACERLWEEVAIYRTKAEAKARYVSDLERRLSVLLGGEWKPATVQELLTVARLATHGHREFAATARLFERSLMANPDWAHFPADSPCYFGVCCAVVAASGEGAGAVTLDEAGRRHLRHQGLAWLRDELGRKNKRLADGTPTDRTEVATSLAYWQGDGWLAGVRDKEALDKLPDDERKEWRQLWDDVAALLKTVEGKK